MSSSIKKLFKETCPEFLLKPLAAVIRILRRHYDCIYMVLFPQAIKKCPCCGARARRFNSGNFISKSKQFNPSRYEGILQEVICPVCMSLPRHRILASWGDAHLQLFKNAKILYFAPEKGIQLWMERNSISYVSADLCRKDADLQLNIQKTGLPDESYDLVICNHILEHVDDFRDALREVFRILTHNGAFICSFPMDPTVELLDEDSSVQTAEERLQRYGQVDHKRVFGMKADQFLTEAGFNVEIIRGDDYPEEILPVVGPANYDANILFCCRKP